MKTTTYGTLEEWLVSKPDALLINRKIEYMSNGAYVYGMEKKNKPVSCTYESIFQPGHYDDYASPYFLIGPGCPYIIKAKHKYFVSIGTVYGGGTTYPIEERHWNDPNWEEIEKIEDALIEEK